MSEFICARCNRPGASGQGHYFKWCSVAQELREFHFCCPGNCELAAQDDQAATIASAPLNGSAERKMAPVDWQSLLDLAQRARADVEVEFAEAGEAPPPFSLEALDEVGRIARLAWAREVALANAAFREGAG